MERIRLLLVGDNEAETAALVLLAESLGFVVTAVARSLEDALASFYANPPDLVICDILLGGRRDGIVFAERMNEAPERTRPIIFLTGFSDRKTFQAASAQRPFAYVLKPYNLLELQYTMERAAEVRSCAAGVSLLPGFFFTRQGTLLIRIAVQHIRCIGVEGKYCKVTTLDGKFLVQLSLKDLQALLPDADFVRIHRNYIVKGSAIRRINVTENLVELTEGESLPLSRDYKRQFLNRACIL